MRQSVLRQNFTSPAVLLLAVLTAACAPTVDGTNTSGQAFQLTIVDPQGLVLSASSLTPEEESLGDTGDGIHPLADPNSIWVTWIGPPCEPRPNLEISQAEGDPLTIELDRGPRESPCEPMETGYGVALILKRPVEIADIVFSVSAGQEP